MTVFPPCLESLCFPQLGCIKTLFYAHFSFLLDLAGTALTIALLWFSLQIPVD